MKRILYFIMLFIAIPVCAESSLEDADNAYMQEHYQKAAEIYEAVLQEGANADVYYNLGNTYYRLNNMGKAVLNYERGLMLEPGNEDLRHNLDICQSKMADQFNQQSEMFFITWMKEAVYSKNADQWGVWGIMSLVFAVLFFGLYRFSNHMGLRKIGFFVGLLLFLVSVFTNVAAAMAHSAFENDNRAVILSTAHLYKTSNDKEEPLRALNPGTTVLIIQENSKGWWEIELPNGKKGWMHQSAAEKIKA